MSDHGVCLAIEQWLPLYLESLEKQKREEFREAALAVQLAVRKSCLLDRMVNCGEKPSETPCPVHEGQWAGIHLGWPGQMWANGRPVEVSELCQKWYDAGCRCFMHKCGCTTGWQPDEACGCGVQP